MKKHTAGLILFCFIVGTAVSISVRLGVVARYNGISKLDVIKTYPNPNSEINETDAAIGKIDDKSPVVRQAVLNANNKQLSLELLFKVNKNFDDRTSLKLSYFKKTAKGVRFINSETVELIPESFDYKNGATTALVISSYEWLDNLDSYDNLYVIAEIDADYSGSKKAVSKFDPNFAKAILRAGGNAQFQPYE
jgi:hypothetical protein